MRFYETNLPCVPKKKKKKETLSMDYNNISIAFRKTFYFRDIIFRSSIDSIKEFSLSSYPEETTHYELYRRVNLFFFSRLDSSLSLSLGGREITRENV